MKLIHKNTGLTAKIGDTVVSVTDNEAYTINYIREPISPESEGQVSVVHVEDDQVSSHDLNVSMFDLEWIGREDRAEPEVSIEQQIVRLMLHTLSAAGWLPVSCTDSVIPTTSAAQVLEHCFAAGESWIHFEHPDFSASHAVLVMDGNDFDTIADSTFDAAGNDTFKTAMDQVSSLVDNLAQALELERMKEIEALDRLCSAICSRVQDEHQNAPSEKSPAEHDLLLMCKQAKLLTEQLARQEARKLAESGRKKTPLIQLGDLNDQHLFCVGIGTDAIEVRANTRTQAADIARAAGYRVRSVNYRMARST